MIPICAANSLLCHAGNTARSNPTDLPQLPSAGALPNPVLRSAATKRSGATGVSCSPKCQESTKLLAKPSDEDLAGCIPCRAGVAVLGCLAGGRRILIGKGCGGPSGSPENLLHKWAGGPGLCWPPWQPIAPSNACFYWYLERMQQKRAAKSGWTFYSRLLVTFPAPFC